MERKQISFYMLTMKNKSISNIAPSIGVPEESTFILNGLVVGEVRT